MNDHDLKMAVNTAIQRHLAKRSTTDQSYVLQKYQESSHPSHICFSLPRGSDVDGSCLIDPRVRCVHCGFCQSLGH